MKIYDFEVVDRCLYWKEKKTLIVGDLHLGYEDSLENSGYIGLPRQQKEENEKIFLRIFNKLNFDIERIILLGDIKHKFGGISRQEFQNFHELIQFLKNSLKNLEKIIITKGNHDKLLEPLLKNYDYIDLVDYFEQGGKLFFHGDSFSLQKVYLKLAEKETKEIVLGHFHPVYILREEKGVKTEKFKCFLYGKTNQFKKKTIYVPSFFPLIEGSDIITQTEIYEKGLKIILIDDEGNLYKK